MKKIFKVIGNCFISLVVGLLLFLLIVNFTSKEHELTKFANYSLLDVNGDSMKPVIKNGDLIVIDRRVKDMYDVGDIVSFITYVNGTQIIVTHEIKEVISDGGSYSYVTKGVNNDEYDNDSIANDKIIGEYINFRIPLLGYIVNFSRTSLGYLLLVIFPLGLILLFTTYELLKEISKSKEEC